MFICFIDHSNFQLNLGTWDCSHLGFVKGCRVPCHAFQATLACTGRLSIFLYSNLFDFPWRILTLSGWRMSWVISWDCCVSGLLYQWHLCASCAPWPRFMCWKQQDVRIFWPTLLITAFYTSIFSHHPTLSIALRVVNDLHVVTPLVNSEESTALTLLLYLSWLIAPFCDALNYGHLSSPLLQL